MIENRGGTPKKLLGAPKKLPWTTLAGARSLYLAYLCFVEGNAPPCHRPAAEALRLGPAFANPPPLPPVRG
jgi:hypothetical protein